MQKYNDIDGDSNVDEFEFGNDYVIVKFFDGSIYTYTYSSAGSHHIEEMKRLALCHDGLNAYISNNRPQYSEKR
ncbi:hypothetical protein L6259_02035 [Candidatus Parcubacteria bacterium]|nr:hypothetical protein [Candidatus Parcubacteria bacterium]